MPTIKLTQAAADRLKAPATGRIEYWDKQCPGFGLRISESGRKTWQVMYRVAGRQVRETIGPAAAFPNVADARQRARESLQKAAAGINPATEREKKKAHARATLAAAIDRYLAERPGDRERHRMSAEYLTETTRTLMKDVRNTPLGERPLAEITSDEIRQHVRRIARATPSQANHVLVYLRAMLGWAVDEGLIDRNPALSVKLPALRVERERALNDDDEIRLFWLACDQVGYPFGRHAQLSLLTGQRRDEVANATWDELNLDKAIWTLPASRSKNGREHLVHLAPLALEILAAIPRRSRFVFTSGMRGTDVPINGFGASRARIADKMQALSEIPIAPWTLHDLRRTAATGMAALGIAPHVVDKILNHSAGKISGVAKIYNRFEYIPERQDALNAWARHIERLIRPVPSRVIEFATAQR
jgi:integrase